MTTATVTTKGQVAIPAKIRRKLNIEKGMKLHVETRGNEIVLTPVTPEFFEKIAGVLPTGGKLSRKLLQERARDKKRGS